MRNRGKVETPLPLSTRSTSLTASNLSRFSLTQGRMVTSLTVSGISKSHTPLRLKIIDSEVREEKERVSWQEKICRECRRHRLRIPDMERRHIRRSAKSRVQIEANSTRELVIHHQREYPPCHLGKTPVFHQALH